MYYATRKKEPGRRGRAPRSSPRAAVLSEKSQRASARCEETTKNVRGMGDMRHDDDGRNDVVEATEGEESV